jgi:hypothetical protein
VRPAKALPFAPRNCENARSGGSRNREEKGTKKGKEMVYKLARVLQLIGLVLLPIAMAGNLAEKLSERDMLLLTGAGIGVFLAGWLLQQAVRPR